MSLEDIVSNDIPLHVASAYFLQMKKEAAWTDAPDMTGTLEGTFVQPVPNVLNKLKEVIAVKLRLMVAYYTYAQSFNDPAWRAIKTEFFEHAEDEQKGATFYMKRAAVLGGPVSMDDVEAPPPAAEPVAILKTLIRAEQEAIFCQRALRQMVGDENPMKIGIEEQMSHDQHHLDELFQILPTEARLALEQLAQPQPEAQAEGGEEAVPPTQPAPQPAADPVMEQEEEAAAEEEEPPPVEKAAAARFDQLLKLAGIGASVQKGVKRTGELLTGSRAKSLETKAVKAQTRLTRAARQAKGVASYEPPSVKARIADEGARSHRHATKYKELATSEAERSGKARIGATAGAAALGAVGAATLHSGKADWEKSEKKAAEILPEERSALRAAKWSRPLAGAVSGAALGGLVRSAVRPWPQVGGASGHSALPYMLGGAALGALGGSIGGTRGMDRDVAEAQRGELDPDTLDTDESSLQSGLVNGLSGLAGSHNPAVAAGMGLAGAGVSRLSRNGDRALAAINDRAKAEKTAAARFDALLKLADEFEAADSMAVPSVQATEPTNYLQAELAARKAQEQSESAYYREQSESSMQQAQQLQQQLADMQMQMQQTTEMQNSAQAQIDQALQQAMTATDQAAMQAQEAAKARMGAQTMRMQMLALASQDPGAFGDAMMGAPQQPGMDPSQDPNAQAQAGAPGQAPSQDPSQGQAPPSGAPGQESAPPGEPSSPSSSPSSSGGGSGGGSESGKSVSVKVGNAMSWAVPAGVAGGALMGAAGSLMLGRKAPHLQQRVEELERKQDGSFRAASALAAAKASASSAELANKHPAATAAIGALGGGVGGLTQGPRLARMGANLSELLRG